MNSNDKPLQKEGFEFMAAVFEVRNFLGHGFTKEVYQEALEVELGARRIPFEAQVELPVRYKTSALRKRFRPDLLVRGSIVVELKSVRSLLPEHEAQILNYLKASGCSVGYLINFGCTDRLEWKRFARTLEKSDRTS
jgi:GxxExxY protein